MELNSKNMKKIMFLIFYAISIFLVLSNIMVVLNFISICLEILTPFIIGVSIAFVLNVFLRLIEKIWDIVFKNFKFSVVGKIKRPICILLTLTLFVGAIFVVAFIVLPEASKTAQDFAKMVPNYIKNIEKWYYKVQDDLKPLYLNIPNIDLDKIDLNKLSSNVISFLTVGGKSIFNTTLGITTAIFAGIVSAFISFVFSIYALGNKETIARQMKKIVRAFFDEETSERIVEITGLANEIFSGFVMGQIVEAIILGILCYIGMVIFRFPYAVMISTLIGFLALIPLLGAYLGTGIGALMILLVDPMKSIWFILFFIILQQLEGNLIYPRVVGKSVGLPGMWVLVAITVGGSIFGVVGILLSVPITSLIYSLLRESVNSKLKDKNLKYYQEEYEEKKKEDVVNDVVDIMDVEDIEKRVNNGNKTIVISDVEEIKIENSKDK